MDTPIDAFVDEFEFLSNFYAHPIIYEGVEYRTLEHAFQAAKSTKPQERAAIALLRTPGAAKRAGRKLVIDRTRWERIKLSVMETLVRIKFSGHPLAEQLYNTKPARLVEGNTWHDNFWGNCRCPKCENIPGQDHLGRILEKVRGEM